jgi:hypothetical protein
MGQGRSRIYNLISLTFLILAVLVIGVVALRLGGPAIERQDIAALPTVNILPTITPSDTPTRTQPPTFTHTPTDTETPTITPTPTDTLAPTATITDTPGPTDTPSQTPTPSFSPTPSPTETPTGPSETPSPTTSPFLFNLREAEPNYTKNFANQAGCAWQGIGGQVLDQANAPVPGLRIHIFGPNAFDRTVDSGSNSLYGPGGWEQPVDNKINGSTYYVELLSGAGTPISPRITVTFPSDCEKNLALVNFIQVRKRS